MLQPLLDSPKRLCGFGAAFAATESLWSIGSKLCWSNCMSATKLHSLVFQSGTTPSLDLHRLSIACAPHADFSVVSQMTGIPIHMFVDGTGRCLSEDLPLLEDLTYKHLRYCEPCLAEGFHSVLMQFPFFVNCPIHFQPLVQCCSSCGNALPYNWPSTYKRAFQCPCGSILFHPDQQHKPLCKARDSKMARVRQEAADWLRATSQYTLNGKSLRTFIDEFQAGEQNQR